ncbi:aminoglycoside phosphotransferase family protein [Aspergillus lucknowensis]|uniref:Aminoglycoside phosphotransferase domain-containing protein n=1 Tax=Aspergillus lucknowensis TaxID=176173 RepID=A0ABR4LT57_9EURO
MGGMNYHIEIQFQDGISGLARIRRQNATSPPPDLRAYIMRSEVATLQFLSKTKVPVPQVFDYSPDDENPIGVGYIQMEKMPGHSLRWSLLSTEQRKKVMSQLADIYIELQRFSFDLMGSLDQPGTERVGFFARESLTDYKDSRMVLMGPFASSREYHIASIKLTMDLIMREECFTPRAIEAYLVYRFLLDTVSKKRLCPRTDDGRLYLKHADSKGDHILIDDEYNLTGIVDWEWAYTAAKSAAFNSPVMLLPVADFYNGENQLGEDELVFAQLLEDKGRADLAGVVREGQILHRLEFCCGYDLADWEGLSWRKKKALN